MKDIQYQQRAISELIDKTIHLLDIGGERRKIVFEAPTGAGKTVMACATLAGIVDELKTAATAAIRNVPLYGLRRANCTCRATAASKAPLARRAS